MKIKEKQAISLIVLVITILVLSILAATVIVSISDTDVISETNKVAFKSDMANYKEIYQMYLTKQTLKDISFDSSTLDGKYSTNEENFKEILGQVSDKYKNNFAIVEGELAYLTEDEMEKEILDALGIRSSDKISKSKSYVGYYADTDGDGEADGVIFADLAVGVSGTWKAVGSVSSAMSQTGCGFPAVEDKTALKDYVLLEGKYTDAFGTYPVIKIAGNGNDRFYVMALEDIASGCWYGSEANSANGYSFSISGNGKASTDYVVKRWNADTNTSKSTSDIWEQVQVASTKYNYTNGWFIPSPNEWATFGIYVRSTGKTYTECGLSQAYWTSSLCDNRSPYSLDFSYEAYGPFSYGISSRGLRLATTF